MASEKLQKVSSATNSISDSDGSSSPVSLTSYSSASILTNKEETDKLAVVAEKSGGNSEIEVVVDMARSEQNFAQSMESQLQESYLPPSVFRKHLILAKNEQRPLERLYQVIDSEMKKVPSEMQSLMVGIGALPDKGSKTNLLPLQSSEELTLNPGGKGPVPVTLEEVDLTQRILLEEVLSNLSIVHSGRTLICLNATVPVLSCQDHKPLTSVDDEVNAEEYVVSTVIEEKQTAPKAVRLEIICNWKEAETFFHKLKHLYLNNLEPGAVVVIQNPAFTESLVLKTREEDSGHGQSEINFCIRVRMEHVKFFAAPTSSSPTHSKLFPIPKVSAAIEAQAAMLGVPAQHLSSVPSGSDDMESLMKEIRIKESLWEASEVDSNLTAYEWRRWGDEYSVARLHTQAFFAYDIAIRFDPAHIDLASSRAAALINLGMYFGAARDVDYINKLYPSNPGFVHRKVNCLWGLGKYMDALVHLKGIKAELDKQLGLKNIDPSLLPEEFRRKSIFIQTIISKTEKFLHQQSSPDSIIVNDKYFNSNGNGNFFIDEPEYYGPVKVVEDSSAGSSNPTKVLRSILVAKQEVKAGRFLAITKAFAIATMDEASKLLVNQKDELINATLQKAAIDKPTRADFFKKSGLETSLGTNSVAVSAVEAQHLTKEEVISLCKKNTYEQSLLAAARTPTKGFWTFPMNIRHACVGGNATWYTSGYLMFIKAIRDIAQGEEIVMAHIDPTKSFEARSQFLEEKGWTCSCPLCNFERSESEQFKLKRVVILGELAALAKFNANYGDPEQHKEFANHEMRKIHYMIEDLMIFRSAFPKLNFPAVEPLINYGTYLSYTNKMDEAIAAFEKAFFIVDNTVDVFSLISVSIKLAYCYLAKKKNKDKNKAKKWYADMKAYANIFFGCLDPVKNNFPREFEYLERKGIASLKI